MRIWARLEEGLWRVARGATSRRGAERSRRRPPMAEDVDLLHKGGMSCYSSLPSLAPRWLQKGAYRAFPRFLLFAACAYVLQHTWNTDRDIGFSQRQTLIADTGLPSLTHKMASTTFLHGARDQGLELAACAARSQVGVGGRSRAVGRLVNVLQTKLQCTIGGGRVAPVLYGLAYSLLHTWNTDRDIGFSQRQTLIADTGLPSLTHMASTIFLHGAHDQQVGVGDRYCAVGVDALTDSIQLIRTDLCPIDGILRIQVDRCPIPLAVPVPRPCGASLSSRAVPPSQPLTPSVGSTPEGVSLTPGLIITTAPGTDTTQTCPRGSPSPRGLAGSVSLHAHIPGDIASFPTQHGAEGAVLTPTSQCEFRSLAYL